MNQHYTKLAQSIIDFALARSEAAADLPHFGLRGRAREVFARDLLTPFLSPNIGTCTGVVVDSEGRHSRQVDVIVYDKTLIPSLMLTGEEGIVPVESVLATVEVKSRLRRSELVSAVENAHSVKALDAKFREVKQGSRVKASPVCSLFAFSSDTRPEEEASRLESAVSEVNEGTDRRVYVPLSAVCVGNTSLTKCVRIDRGDTLEPTFETHTTMAAMKFMVFLVDQVSILEQQRGKMLISDYFLESADA